MRTVLAAVVVTSVFAVVNCQQGTPQCIIDYYRDNPDVVIAVNENCASVFDQVRFRVARTY